MTGSFKMQHFSLPLTPLPPAPALAPHTMERNRLATSYRSQLAVQYTHLWQDPTAFLCIFQTGTNKQIVNHKFLLLTAQGSLPILDVGSGSEAMLSPL